MARTRCDQTDIQTDRQGDSYITPPPQTLFSGGIKIYSDIRIGQAVLRMIVASLLLSF